MTELAALLAAITWPAALAVVAVTIGAVLVAGLLFIFLCRLLT